MNMNVNTNGATREPMVFISYSRADRSFVDMLTRLFDEDNISYWRDIRQVRVGDVIDEKISAGIQRSALFLIVLSPTSIVSKWCIRELREARRAAIAGSKIILPVLVAGLEEQQIPPELSPHMYADFSTDDQAETVAAYGVLRESIINHIEEQARKAILRASGEFRSEHAWTMGECNEYISAHPLDETGYLHRSKLWVDAKKFDLAMDDLKTCQRLAAARVDSQPTPPLANLNVPDKAPTVKYAPAIAAVEARRAIPRLPAVSSSSLLFKYIV